jgi:hypothetical protein
LSGNVLSFGALRLAFCSMQTESGGRENRSHSSKRSSQIQDGFRINSDLPREPYLPWNRWWWTRMFDAGFKWIRIGQYENSSDRNSWKWIEQKGACYLAPRSWRMPRFARWTTASTFKCSLLYGNPMFTAAAGKLPDKSTPEPGSFHNADRSLYTVFCPPKRLSCMAQTLKGTLIERRIEKLQGNESQWKRIAKIENGASEYADSGLSKGASPAYRVRTYKDAAESAYSNIVHVTVPGK